MDKPKLTSKQVLEKLESEEFDFEKLLNPYREGGTPNEPVKRTWGTMIRWLIDKHRFTPEETGAGILLVCLELKDGKTFEGNGSYGSKGHDLAQYIRNTCAVIRETREAEKVFALMGRKFFSQVEGIVAEKIRQTMKPWWKRIF